MPAAVVVVWTDIALGGPALFIGETVKIYVATSWRNEYQPAVVGQLRREGHEVYDFKNPRAGDRGFHWTDVGLLPSEKHGCTPSRLLEALAHPRAKEGFASDFNAMRWADAGVLVLPCGRSAHLEAGWMAGAGKPVFVLMPPAWAPPLEPELMYELCGHYCLTLDDLTAALAVGA